MAEFSIRVVLHGATAQDYQDLHANLAKIGCRRVVTGDDGRVFDLPDGNYDLNSSADILTVREAVRVTADAIRADASVLVAEYVRLSWWLRTPPSQS